MKKFLCGLLISVFCFQNAWAFGIDLPSAPSLPSLPDAGGLLGGADMESQVKGMLSGVDLGGMDPSTVLGDFSKGLDLKQMTQIDAMKNFPGDISRFQGALKSATPAALEGIKPGSLQMEKITATVGDLKLKDAELAGKMNALNSFKADPANGAAVYLVDLEDKVKAAKGGDMAALSELKQSGVLDNPDMIKNKVADLKAKASGGGGLGGGMDIFGKIKEKAVLDVEDGYTKKIEKENNEIKSAKDKIKRIQEGAKGRELNSNEKDEIKTEEDKIKESEVNKTGLNAEYNQQIQAVKKAQAAVDQAERDAITADRQQAKAEGDKILQSDKTIDQKREDAKNKRLKAEGELEKERVNLKKAESELKKQKAEVCERNPEGDPCKKYREAKNKVAEAKLAVKAAEAKVEEAIKTENYILTMQLFTEGTNYQFDTWNVQTETGNEASLNLTQTKDLNDPKNIINRIIKLLASIMGTIGVLLLVIAGIMMVISHGDENLLTKGKQMFIYTAVGLAVGFLAYIIVQLVVAIIFKVF